MAIDPSTQVGRMRLLTGDVEGYFDDPIYQHQLDEGKSELEGAIEVLEYLINAFALMPSRERAGAYETYNLNLSFLDGRLDELKKRRYSYKKAPVVINSGQDSWDWFDNIFGK